MLAYLWKRGAGGGVFCVFLRATRAIETWNIREDITQCAFLTACFLLFPQSRLAIKHCLSRLPLWYLGIGDN